MPHHRSRRLVVAAVLAGAALAATATGLAGCSNDAGGPTSGPAAPRAVAPDTADRAAAGEPGNAVDPQAGTDKAPPAEAADGKALADQGNRQAGAAGDRNAAGQAKNPALAEPAARSIIYSGTITVRVSDVDAAAATASATATGAGGFVGGDQRTIDARRSQATLILRVPSGRFGAVLDALKGLGKEEHRSVQTQDVTEQIADLDSRIATARASVDRVRALLARAQTISEIVSLESELSRRESDLESLQARMRKLSDLTALSTITAVLLGPEAKTAKPDKKRETGFLAGLADGWHAFVASLVVLLTVLGALLPWIVVLGGPVLFLLWLLRRSRRRREAPTRPLPAPAPAQTPAPVAPAGTAVAPGTRGPADGPPDGSD